MNKRRDRRSIFNMVLLMTKTLLVSIIYQPVAWQMIDKDRRTQIGKGLRI
ncbi:MAG: hypothetical protein PUP93_14930 [Rhizonema sp. NSF051]|nr:hypothetical protein [Rhizonema sp. NSF051]